MKDKTNKKAIYTILPVLGFALLLLLSPCKVRNFIQAELGIPQTDVLNKSKSTFSSFNCSDFEANTNFSPKEKAFSQQTPYFSAGSELDLITYIFPTTYIKYILTRDHQVSLIPLYILYQNLKDYL